ncbi:hypothetical protein CON37_28925 [Bacillus cereus]|nr:hypothetical protein CON37_28925 [Bacillus cereus]
MRFCSSIRKSHTEFKRAYRGISKSFKKNGSGAKKLNDLKMVFQTWSYWYYYFKKVCGQYGKRKYIQMETLSAR